MANFLTIYLMHKYPLKTLHLYVFFSLAIFLCVQSFKFYSIEVPNWIFYYLNDFLVIPMVATLSVHVVWFIKKTKTIRLNVFTIISLVTLFSIYFEYYLPQQSCRYTGDFWDVICYSSGGIAFYFLQKLS